MKISAIFQTKAIWQSLISCIVTNLSWIMAFCVTGTPYYCVILTFWPFMLQGSLERSQLLQESFKTWFEWWEHQAVLSIHDKRQILGSTPEKTTLAY